MKQRKRKIVRIISVLIVLVLVAACGQNNGASNDGGAGGQKENLNVEFWLDKMADQEIGEKVSAQWLEDSDIEVELINYPDVAAYQTAIQQSIDDAAAPGLFTWWSGPQLETLVTNGKLVDLTEEWEHYINHGVSPDVKEAFTIDGKAYAAPYSILYNTVLYNKNVFEEAGIEEMPTTFDDFLEVCEKIKATGVTPIGIKNDSWASFIWFQQLVAAYDYQLYLDICDGTVAYTDEKVVEVMEIWKSMFDKGYFGQPVLYSDMYRDLATGSTAMMLEASPTASVMEKEYGMVPEEDLGALTIPSMSGQRDVIFFEASPIVVPVASDDKDAAIKALQSFYSQGTQSVMVNELGIANTAEVEVQNPTIQTIIDMTSDQDGYQLILRYYENTPSEIRDLALDELSRFMYSGADINEVLSNIQVKADEVWGN